MDIHRQTAEQLRCPHGEEGAEFGRSMNLRNLAQILSAFEAASIDDGARILEIGCGNGGLLGWILSQADDIHYTGLEISELMHREAQAFNAPFIAAGMAEYRLYDGNGLPFADESFDTVIAVNNLYFWHDAALMLGEISRTLRPGGRLYLNFGERGFMQTLPFAAHGFTHYDAADVRRLAAALPLRCTLERQGADWAIAKSGALVRREFVDLVFEKQAV